MVSFLLEALQTARIKKGFGERLIDLVYVSSTKSGLRGLVILMKITSIHEDPLLFRKNRMVNSDDPHGTTIHSLFTSP